MENTYKELCWHSYFCFYFHPDSQCSVSATPYRKAIAEERGYLILIKMALEIIVSPQDSHTQSSSRSASLLTLVL